MKIPYQLILLLSLAFIFGVIAGWPACAAMPEPYRVVDGDTVVVQGRSYRLIGFDTPETYRPRCDSEAKLGNEATKITRQLLKHPKAKFTVMPGVDFYSRGLARITIANIDLGDILIGVGLAHSYKPGEQRQWCQK
jgi:micrococcal nuclease